jgi:hypothetical protein
MSRQKGTRPILYRDQDFDVINKNMKSILEKTDEAKLIKLTPTKKEREEVGKAIREFIKEKKRIVYGGTALHNQIASKNKGTGIYGNEILHDIEFYSYTPLQDLTDLVDYLAKKKFEAVRGTEAQHKETYTIFVNHQGYCDISYVPRLVYQSIPYTIIKGMKMVHPHFALIDQFRILTDPLTSYYNLEKVIPRIKMLLTYFPLDFNSK